MSVANGWEDLRIAVKCQSNSEIAGSRRNIFRYSLFSYFFGGRALDGLSGIFPFNPIKLRIPKKILKGVRMWGLSLIFKRETAQTVI